MFRLDQKVAVIIGGNGLLGKQFCKALLEQGAKVYAADLITNEDDFVRNLKEKYPDKYFLQKVDGSDRAELENLNDYIISTNASVDILINNTTVKGSDFFLPFEEASLEGWNYGLLGNLTIPFLSSQVFVPIMKKNRSGSIINIASLYGIVGNDQRIYEGSNLHEIYVKQSPNLKRVYSNGVYNAAKGGLINFTRYLAAYYGEFNVRVNSISPGGIYYPQENEVFLKKYSDKTPLGRKANPDEINGAVVFLASNESSYVTGHNLVVDGGFTIW